MSAVTTGLFENYSSAGDVVRELELLGISGEQVEVVTDAGRDARGEGFVSPPVQDQSAPSREITMVVVRPSDGLAVEQAKDIMKRHGAKVWQAEAGAKKKKTPAPIPPDPSQPPMESSKNVGIGGPTTTGHDPTDLEGRGRNFDVHNPGAPGEKETQPPRDPDHLPS